MDTIKFANGEEHSCSFCATIPTGEAYIALDDVNLTGAAQLFTDTTKTARIEYGDMILSGFTTCKGLYVVPYGIQAVMAGGTVSEKDNNEVNET